MLPEIRTFHVLEMCHELKIVPLTLWHHELRSLFVIDGVFDFDVECS